MLDLNTLDFSGMMPVTSTLAFRGSGNGSIDVRPCLESEISERSFSIFFGRGSFDVRSSRARLASVSIMSP